MLLLLVLKMVIFLSSFLFVLPVVADLSRRVVTQVVSRSSRGRSRDSSVLLPEPRRKLTHFGRVGLPSASRLCVRVCVCAPRPTTMSVVLFSKENEKFEVPVDVAKLMGTVKSMMEGTSFCNESLLVGVDTGDEASIQLSNIDSKTLRRVVDYCTHHHQHSRAASVCVAPLRGILPSCFLLYVPRTLYANMHFNGTSRKPASVMMDPLTKSLSRWMVTRSLT